MNEPRPNKRADELYQTRSDLSAGAAALLAEIFISMIIATAIKFLAGEISIPVILLIRYSFSLPILITIAVHQRGRNALHVVDVKTLLLRSVFGLVGLSMWFLALSKNRAHQGHCPEPDAHCVHYDTCPADTRRESRGSTLERRAHRIDGSDYTPAAWHGRLAPGRSVLWNLPPRSSPP